MTWFIYGRGYLSGSLDSGYFKETWGTGETKSITPVSGSQLVRAEKKCYNKDGSEKTCMNTNVRGWSNE